MWTLYVFDTSFSSSYFERFCTSSLVRHGCFCQFCQSARRAKGPTPPPNEQRRYRLVGFMTWVAYRSLCSPPTLFPWLRGASPVTLARRRWARGGCRGLTTEPEEMVGDVGSCREPTSRSKNRPRQRQAAAAAMHGSFPPLPNASEAPACDTSAQSCPQVWGGKQKQNKT